MDLALNQFVLDRINFVHAICEQQALGAHTDVIVFQPGSVKTYRWAHPGARPMGNSTSNQCPNVTTSRLCLQKSLMKASPQALSSAQHVGGNRPTIFPMALSGVRENLQPREGRGELGWFPSYLILNRLLILHKVGSPQRLGSQMRTLLWIYLSYLVWLWFNF